MIEFEKTILHILDSEHNTLINSDECMRDMSVEIEKMLQTKTSKVFASSAKKKCEFKEGGHIALYLNEYKESKTTFEEMSQKIAQFIFDAKMKYGLFDATDLIVSEVLFESRRYIVAIENAYSEGVTHNLVQKDEHITNEVIPYRTLLSLNLVKNDRAFIVELSDMSVSSVESKVEIEADKVNFYASIVLESESTPSYSEALSSISKTVAKLGDKFEIDEMDLIPKMKGIINDSVAAQTPIKVQEVGTLLFADKPLAQNEFQEEMRTQGISKDIEVEFVKSSKRDKMQKIKTDKGIEINIPVDYMNSKEFVEFQTQSDGTISIQLKNINHISSK
ncbi:MAG: nucleoid-associated protein [Longicatena sp.]